MKIEMFVLCDAATDQMGKMNILGTFDSIHARQAPVVHPLCAVAMRLRFTRSERGDHRIRLNIIDADGRSIAPPLEAGLHVRFPDENPSFAMNLIFNLQGMRFERFGEYSVDLTVDGQPVGSLPLFIRQVRSP